MNATLFVEKTIGWIACQPNILLNGMLLVIWKVIVNTIGLRKIVLCDDVFPRLLWRTVRQIEIHDVVILQFCLEFVRLAQLPLAWRTSCAPDVKIYYLAPIWLNEFVDDSLTVGESLHIG